MWTVTTKDVWGKIYFDPYYMKRKREQIWEKL